MLLLSLTQLRVFMADNGDYNQVFSYMSSLKPQVNFLPSVTKGLLINFQFCESNFAASSSVILFI